MRRRNMGLILATLAGSAVAVVLIGTTGSAGAAPEPQYAATTTRAWPGMGISLAPASANAVPGLTHAAALAAAARLEPGAHSLTGREATATLGLFTDTAYAQAATPDQPILKDRLVWLVETPDSPVPLASFSSNTPGCPRVQVLDATTGDELMGFRSCTVRIPDPALATP